MAYAISLDALYLCARRTSGLLQIFGECMPHVIQDCAFQVARGAPGCKRRQRQTQAQQEQQEKIEEERGLAAPGLSVELMGQRGGGGHGGAQWWPARRWGQPWEPAAASQALCSGVDNEGRPYDFSQVVVNFINVGINFGKKFAKPEWKCSGKTPFHWEGVRRCVGHLADELGYRVIGVISRRNWRGLDDLESPRTVEGVPADIRPKCEFIEDRDAPRQRRLAEECG
ncbi:unnamed protein product [Prorocentrum cordatum]|uniref:Uncharacterized protein n=1 Tax=Prorocentrum cordatum TaxID=2364126 RepID=A0ABN9QBN2_9DINO|nr:unnamed protein product [Polarella glacialis]